MEFGGSKTTPVRHKKKDMNDRGTYDSVPTRLKVADVLVNYGKDVSFTRNGLIKSPFRDEEKEVTRTF